MKNKNFLLVPVLFMIIAGCNGVAIRNRDSLKFSYEDSREILEEVLEDVPIEVVDYEDDLTPLPLEDDIECEASESLVKFKHGDSDQFVFVSQIDQADCPFVSNYVPKEGDIILRDENDNPVDFNLVSCDCGVAKYAIPVSSFSEDHFYHLELKNEDLKFVSKDKGIRDITYYSLNVNDKNRRNTYERNDETYTNYDLSIVQYFDVDAFGAYFITDEVIDLEPESMFRIADLNIEKDNKDTTYGRFVSSEKNPNGSGYIVRYEPCNGKDVYKTIDVNDSITVSDDNIENLELYADENTVREKLAKNFLTHDETIAAVMGLMNHYGVSPENYHRSAIDWASKIQVAFDLKFEDSVFTWGCTLSLNLNPTDYLNIKIILSYKQTTKYDITAELDIDYWLFVPVGIDYKLEVKEDDTKEVSFKIVLSTNLNPYDEEKVKEGIEKDLTDALLKDTDFKSKFSGDSPTGTAEGVSYPLLRFDCYYFFPLDIRLEIDFYWQLQLTFETDITYTSHTVRTDVSISNKKGCDPSSETKAQNDKSLRLYFMGTFHAEIGLRVSFGIGISGFYKFFHAEVYIKAYGAVDAQGFLLTDITWGDQGMSVIGTIGGKFEISAGAKWGVDVKLLFGGVNLEWPIKTWVLIGFATDNSVNRFTSDGETVEITDKDYGEGKFVNLDDYHLLGIESFDAKSFGVQYTDMKYDDTASTRYGAWLSPNEERYFTAEVIEGGQYITLDGFKLSINSISGITEFNAKIKVTVDEDLICSDQQEVSKIINIHFKNNLTQEIFIDDQGTVTSIGTYVIGQTTTLPVPVPPQYKRFTGWKNKTTEEFMPYDESDPNTGKYTVPDITEPNTVTFELVYEDYYFWTVVWVDGFGNIVKIDSVFMNEAAVEPSAEVRDRYMVSNDANYKYVFVGYDQDFSSVKKNMVIRAIYEYQKVGA